MYGKNNKKRRVYVELDERTAKEFKKRVVDYEMSMSEILRPAIEEFLRTHGPMTERKLNID